MNRKDAKTFDEASAETEALFDAQAQQTAEEGPQDLQPPVSAADGAIAPQEEERTVNSTTPEGEAVQNNAQAAPQITPEQAEQALRAAEMAAQAAGEADAKLQQALQALEAERQKNEQLQNTLSQMSKQQEETLVQQSTQMPVMDLSNVAFEDEETMRQRQQDYAKSMYNYVKDGVMQELSPYVEQAREGLRQKEKAEALQTLGEVPELAGIREMQPQLDRIISANPWLSNSDMPMDEKYINAYVIAKGARAIKEPPVQPKEPTAEELMQFYEANPEFRDMVEQKRLEKLQPNQQVPVFSASSGAVNAAPNIPKAPQNFEEASERTRRMFENR